MSIFTGTMAVSSFVSKPRRYADGGLMPMQGAPALVAPACLPVGGAPGPETRGPLQNGGGDPGAQLQAAATQYTQTKNLSSPCRLPTW